MQMTYRMAQAMALSAFVPAWLPPLAGWHFHDPRAVASYTVAILVIAIPWAYDKFGPGLAVAQ